jgi:hypothetical protein
MTPRKLAAIAAIHCSVEAAAFDFGGEELNAAFREIRAADALIAQVNRARTWSILSAPWFRT